MFQHDSYTRLRITRSQREANLIKRLELLDRRTYEIFSDSGESSRTSSFKSANPIPYLLTHGLQGQSGNLDDKDVKTWISDMEKSCGMESRARIRVFKCVDSIKTGSKVEQGVDGDDVPNYLVIHELLDKAACSFVADQVTRLDFDIEVVEARSWQLYRAYPGIAQSNVSE